MFSPPSTLTLAFALIVFLVFGFIGVNIMHTSGRKAEMRQREQWNRNGGAPEHGMIDDEPSAGAKLLAYLFATVGMYLSVAILMGNLLWVIKVF
jgi:hypothetical protein